MIKSVEGFGGGVPVVGNVEKGICLLGLLLFSSLHPIDVFLEGKTGTERKSKRERESEWG